MINEKTFLSKDAELLITQYRKWRRITLPSERKKTKINQDKKEIIAGIWNNFAIDPLNSFLSI